MTTFAVHSDELVALLTRAIAPPLTRMADAHGHLHSPDDGKFVSKTGGIAGVAAAAADKLKLAGRIQLGPGEKLLSSRKIRTRTDADSWDLVAAEVDTPQGRQIRLGVVAFAKNWAAGPDPETARRKAELNQQIEALEDGPELFGDDLDSLDALREELEELGSHYETRYDRTVTLVPEAVAAMRADIEAGVTEARRLEKEFEKFWDDHADDVEFGDTEITHADGILHGGPDGDLAYEVISDDEARWNVRLGIKPPDAKPNWFIGSIADDEAVIGPGQVKALLKDLAEMAGVDHSSSGGTRSASMLAASIVDALVGYSYTRQQRQARELWLDEAWQRGRVAKLTGEALAKFNKDHPRAPNGKFGSGGGAAAPAKKAAKAVAKAAPAPKSAVADGPKTELGKRLVALPATTDGIEQARLMVSGLKVAELKALAAEIGPTVNPKGNKKQLADNIVEGAVGFRARANAIGAYGDRPYVNVPSVKAPPVKDVPAVKRPRRKPTPRPKPPTFEEYAANMAAISGGEDIWADRRKARDEAASAKAAATKLPAAPATRQVLGVKFSPNMQKALADVEDSGGLERQRSDFQLEYDLTDDEMDRLEAGEFIETDDDAGRGYIGVTARGLKALEELQRPRGGGVGPKADDGVGGSAADLVDAALVTERLQRLRGTKPADDTPAYRAQLRQAKIDLARDRAQVLASLEEAVALNDDDPVVASRRFRQEIEQHGLQGDVRLNPVTDAFATGDRDKIKAALGEAALGARLSRIGGGTDAGPDELVAFDRKLHKPVGDPLRPGQKARLVRPGYEADVDGKRVVVEQAAVEGVDAADIRPAQATAKPAAIKVPTWEELGKPRGRPPVGRVIGHEGGTYERLPGELDRYRVIAADGRDISDQVTTSNRWNPATGSFTPTHQTADDARAALSLYAFDRGRIIADERARWRKTLALVPGAYHLDTGEVSGFDAATPTRRKAIQDALRSWKQDLFDTSRGVEPNVNAALRGRMARTAKTDADVAALDHAFDLSRTSRPITVYRGVIDGQHILPDDWQTRDLTGLEWKDDAYTATSAKKDFAAAYVGAGETKGFGIRIKLPKGSPAIALPDAVGGLDAEGEIMLPRGARFRVVKDNGPKGKFRQRWLDVELVGIADAASSRRSYVPTELSWLLQRAFSEQLHPRRPDGQFVEKPGGPGWLSSAGHLALDVAGWVPVWGEAADIANAAWYLKEHNYVDAALSAMSAVPVSGNASGAVKTIKSLKTLKTALRARRKMRLAAKAAKEARR